MSKENSDLPFSSERERDDTCPNCRKMTRQSLELFNPDEDTEPTVWVCSECKEAIDSLI